MLSESEHGNARNPCTCCMRRGVVMRKRMLHTRQPNMNTHVKYAARTPHSREPLARLAGSIESILFLNPDVCIRIACSK